MTQRLKYKIGIAIPMFLFFALPLIANGGVFQFVTNLLHIDLDGESTAPSFVNSQTMPLLSAAHHVDPNPSKGGGDITIVEDSALLADTGPAGTAANIEDRPKSDQISIYVVREADTLTQIGEMFGVSVNTIIWANDLRRGALITPGETLVILPISGVKHIVKEDETLASIVEEYEGNLEEVANYNDIDPSSPLAVGTEVIIPDGEFGTAHYHHSGGDSHATPIYQGYFIHPVPGAPITQYLHGFNAIDFGGGIGTPVVAAASGQVLLARYGGWNGGYGNYIVIKHDNGTQTLYSHLNGGIVYSGQWVVQGQVIGYVGNTGRSTGPHLHFEVRGAANPFAN